MNTSSIHRSAATFVTVAATTLAGALSATTLASAHASPEADGYPTVPVRIVHTTSDYVERACFMERPSWNEALDGPVPRCRTHVH